MKDVYEVAPEVAGRAHIDEAKYQQMYKQSIDDPEGVLEGPRSDA